MSKDFIVFGDSLSYGHELVDAPYNNVISGKISPSKFSWPALLGALNYSVPGSANDRIKRNCIHTTFTLRPKLVGISWSYPERLEFPDPSFDKIDPEQDYFNTIGHWIAGNKKPTFNNKQDIRLNNFETFVNIFYKFIYSDVFGMYNFLDNIYAVQLHLDKLNIDYFMVTPSYKTLQLNNRYVFDYQDDPINMDKIIGSVVRTCKLIDWSKFVFIDKFKGIMDIANDLNDIGKQNHPLEKTHEYYANYLKDVTI